MNNEYRISVVIPVLGDGALLGSLVERIRAMSTQPFEIIIVDGDDDGDCVAVAERFRCIRLRTRSGRGNQLHAGAMRAGGDAIWFLHADAEPPADALDRIRDALTDGAIGGHFNFRFAGRPAWYKSLLATLINLRCSVGVPYGDQGLFIRRSVYNDIDGFADVPLFEEVAFVRAARKKGRFVALDTPLGVSPRRWERDGWLRRTLHNRLLAAAYSLGIPPSRLARQYARDAGKESAKC